MRASRAISSPQQRSAGYSSLLSTTSPRLDQGQLHRASTARAPISMPVDKLHPAVLERIFALASLDQALWETPDYATLKACALVYKQWRHPAQATLARHVRIASPEAMAAVRSRECRRMLAEHQTLVLDSTFLWGADTYWLLDRFPKLVSFRLEYDPLRGKEDGQGERDDEWLTWDVLRHPSLAGASCLPSPSLQ